MKITNIKIKVATDNTIRYYITCDNGKIYSRQSLKYILSRGKEINIPCDVEI